MSVRYLELGQTVGCSLPLLEIFTIVSGDLVDVEVLEYTIFDSAGDQVNASQPAREVVDTTVDCPAGLRKGAGHYLAGWTVPASVTGTYTINWYWKLTATDDEIAYSTTFEVLAAGKVVEPLAPYYLTIAQLREEGVTEAIASDERALMAIAMAGRMAEMWTQRFFEPRAHTYHIKGTGNRRAFLDAPIIAIDEVRTEATARDEDDDEGILIEKTMYRIFNRHITEGLLSPDDRNNPKLEMIHGRDIYGRSAYDDFAGLSLGALIFPSGPQTVKVSGVFGYTDPDGSIYGRTPRMFQYALALLAMRYLPKLTDFDNRNDAINQWKLVSEKTRDQSYSLMQARGGRGAMHHTVTGYLTGNPEIDNILIMYLRPPALGAV